ncbi:MAG: hypothetical protein ACFNX3_00335 [Haemophilus parainfluenzae]
MTQHNDYDSTKSNFDYDPRYGIWYTNFEGNLAYVARSSYHDIKTMTLEQMQVDKPVYLAVMAHKQQLQPILDNPHLFDPALVNAVKLIVGQYNDLTVTSHD